MTDQVDKQVKLGLTDQVDKKGSMVEMWDNHI